MMKMLIVVTMMATVLAVSGSAFAFTSMKAIEGKIANVAPDGRSVSLVDGPTFTVSPSLSTERLRAGEEVTVAYNDQSGQKQMTAFWIDAGQTGRNG